MREYFKGTDKMSDLQWFLTENSRVEGQGSTELASVNLAIGD
jgi:hypothetical protein